MSTHDDLIRAAHEALIREYAGGTAADLQALLVRVDTRWGAPAFRWPLVHGLVQFAAEARWGPPRRGALQRELVHSAVLDLYDELRRQRVAAHLANRQSSSRAENGHSAAG
jgi:hypothetical protein